VRRVFIMDDAEHLMPPYLRFIRGVIDSNDLPLNVSREILQESRDVETIRAGSVRRVLSLLDDLAGKEPDKYARFWKEFGRVFKEGVGEDDANRERIANLLRFASTRADTDEESVSLADYVSRMRPGQEKIYYVTAETFSAAKNSPHLEVFRKKGVEVLLLHDRVDEWVVGHLTEFDGKPLQSVAKGRLELGPMEDEEERKAQEQDAGEFRDLAERVKKALGERVKEVRVTHRLTESPACLVSDQHELGANLQRILKSVGQKSPDWKPILEINPRHPLVQRMKADAGDPRFDDMSHVLFDQSLLAEGGQVEDPAAFVKRLNGLMLQLSSRKP
jgi:molecular chaperone HtpG